MTLEEIKRAVLEGKCVYWSNKGYKVVYKYQVWWIEHTRTKNIIRLTHVDSDVLNGEPEEFFIVK